MLQIQKNRTEKVSEKGKIVIRGKRQTIKKNQRKKQKDKEKRKVSYIWGDVATGYEKRQPKQNSERQAINETRLP